MRTIVGFMCFASLCVAQTPLVPALGPDEVPFTQIEVGMDSPLKASGVQVINTADQWKEFLTKLDELDLKRPKIDWNKSQIVVATLEGSTKDGVALQVMRLHNTKPGHTDIEFELSKDHTSAHYVSEATSHNTLGKPQFPYAIIETAKMDTKWNIKVLD